MKLQAPSDKTLHLPAGVWSDGKRLVVVDRNNSRVLIWREVPTSDFQPANVVLGQSDFTHVVFNDGNSLPTDRTLNLPYNGVSSNGVQLAIADTDNNRVLIWNSFPDTNFKAADVVLGQSDFAHANEETASERTLNHPTGVLFYRDKLLVVDGGNSRVLIFNSK